MRSHRCALRSLRELRVLNDWVLAPLHILPYKHSSLHIAYVRSHRCALAGSVVEQNFILLPASWGGLIQESADDVPPESE